MSNVTLTFVKLGGSFITDKRAAESFHAEATARAAREMAAACANDPNLRLLIGHGSGSFGHTAAERYGTMRGVRTKADWRGFAEVALAARKLNNLVTEALHAAGLPIVSIQPSASARCFDGHLARMDDKAIKSTLKHGLTPLVYGDVAFDTLRGGTIISTEAIFFYLAERLHPTRIFLLGEVEGVYDVHGAIIPRITTGNFESIAGALGGSHGTDVTGGMASKVRTMLTLTERVPHLQIRIFGGTAPGTLEAALRGESAPGTLIESETQ